MWKISIFFSMMKKHESMFPTIGFLVHRILSIISPQIEIERIFSLVGIFTNFKKCRLQLDNLDKWIFVNKNWPSDLRIDCKPFSNLVELIEIDGELKKFDRIFERAEIFGI